MNVSVIATEGIVLEANFPFESNIGILPEEVPISLVDAVPNPANLF